jgi:glycosyltransferase involved in cell wall biosynthesis
MEDWIIRLAQDLAADCSVTVATYGPCHLLFSKKLAEIRVEWQDLAIVESGLFYARRWFAENTDVCHFSLFAPRDLAVVAAQLNSGVSVIFQDCFSSPVEVDERSFGSALADKVTFHRVKKVIGVSKFVTARIRERFRVSEDRLATIYNGVDPERFRTGSLSSQHESIVCVAALIPEKGVEFLVRAMVNPSLATRELRIVGEGPERERLEALTAELGLVHRVSFLGIRSDVQDIIADSAVVVHPAIWGEAFGLTIVEAMASGRPVVASAVGAIPELIKHDVTGVLVPPRSSAAIADALGDLLQNGSRRDRIGHAAREHAIQVFSLSAWVEENARLVRQFTRRP